MFPSILYGLTQMRRILTIEEFDTCFTESQRSLWGFCSFSWTKVTNLRVWQNSRDSAAKKEILADGKRLSANLLNEGEVRFIFFRFTITEVSSNKLFKKIQLVSVFSKRTYPISSDKIQFPKAEWDWNFRALVVRTPAWTNFVHNHETKFVHAGDWTQDPRLVKPLHKNHKIPKLYGSSFHPKRFRKGFRSINNQPEIFSIVIFYKPQGDFDADFYIKIWRNFSSPKNSMDFIFFQKQFFSHFSFHFRFFFLTSFQDSSTKVAIFLFFKRDEEEVESW